MGNLDELLGRDDDDNEEEEQSTVDEVYWTFNSEKGWYTLSKSYTKVREESTSKFQVVSNDELLAFLNDPKHPETLVEWNPLSTNKILLQTIEKRTFKNVKTDSGPKVELPLGVFKFEFDRMGNWGLMPYGFSTDEYVDLSSHTGKIEEDIEMFLKKKEVYHQHNLLHKRGILLYGPPGTGKTMLVEHIARKFTDKARIIFGPESIRLIKGIEPFINDVPAVLIMEEFTQYNGEEVLSFLDGENSIDGCLIIGTTNYPQHIPGNLVDRPGRFDSLYEIGLPDETTRKTYLEAKLGTKVSEQIVKQSQGLTLAYLRELIVAARVYGKSFEEVFSMFKDRKDKVAEFKKYREADYADDIWDKRPRLSSIFRKR